MKIKTDKDGKIQVDLSSLELDPEIIEKIKAGLEKAVSKELSGAKVKDGAG